MRALVFGCGYLGSRVAHRWREDGHEVFAVTRSPRRVDEWQAEGLRPLVADVTDPASLAALPEVNQVLFAVGYDRQAKHSQEEVYVDGLAHVLSALPEGLERFIYISSTGVYGPGDGGEIDERTPPAPTTTGGRACLAAENLLRQSRFAERSIVLRLAGIYGPGRLPRSRELLSGQPLAIDPASYLNLIHVEDAAGIVTEVARQIPTPALFCVSDGNPVTREEYLGLLAELLQAPRPVFDPPEKMALQRRGGNKLVSNARLVRELEYAWKYPSYREGLAALVEAGEFNGRRTDTAK